MFVMSGPIGFNTLTGNVFANGNAALSAGPSLMATITPSACPVVPAFCSCDNWVFASNCPSWIFVSIVMPSSFESSLAFVSMPSYTAWL